MQTLPKAKTENIVVQNLQDEVLIYDLKTDQAFCLNKTAAKVFNRCDGTTTFAALTGQSGLTEDIIYLALDELKKHNLIEESYTSPFAGLSRREVIRKVGLASMIALPVVAGLVAPTAAQAQSGQAQATCATSGSCSCTFFSATTAGARCIVNGFGYTGTCSSTGATQCFACRTNASCNAGDVCPGTCSTT